MDSDQYQQLARRTLADRPGFALSDQEAMLVWNAVGLTGEAGEVADVVKKTVFHRHPLDLEKLKKEIGDVLWYAAGLCSTLGISLSDVMQTNIDKLKVRYPNGYNSHDSIHRQD